MLRRGRLQERAYLAWLFGHECEVEMLVVSAEGMRKWILYDRRLVTRNSV